MVHIPSSEISSKFAICVGPFEERQNLTNKIGGTDLILKDRLCATVLEYCALILLDGATLELSIDTGSARYRSILLMLAVDLWSTHKQLISMAKFCG